MQGLIDDGNHEALKQVIEDTKELQIMLNTINNIEYNFSKTFIDEVYKLIPENKIEEIFDAYRGYLTKQKETIYEASKIKVEPVKLKVKIDDNEDIINTINAKIEKINSELKDKITPVRIPMDFGIL